jgi:hypothetical protein
VGRSASALAVICEHAGAGNRIATDDEVAAGGRHKCSLPIVHEALEAEKAELAAPPIMERMVAADRVMADRRGSGSIGSEISGGSDP